ALRTADISPLPGLAVAAARSRKPDLAWEALERNLARGLLDHLTAQPLDPEERKRELAMLERLNLLDRQIDELRGRRPQTAADRQRVEAAEAERDAAQVDLAKFQAGLTALHGVTAGEVYPLARIQTQIPDGAALVAWVDLPHVSNWHDPKGDHWACLVKRTGEPVWVQLAGTGPRDAWTDEDDRLRHRFRRSLEERRPKEDWRDLKERLARQRFGPLADHLQGVRHLIILPSAEMAGIPVEALSDLTVTYAPSGTMFAWLRDRPAAGNKLPARHLLALGDPAFKTGPDGPVPLPGSRQELAGIARLFDESKQLMGPKASEEALAGLAAEAGGLGRFPYLHFATHGVLDKQRPMRSALLLARGSGPGSAGGKNAYDDRLTAERMLRQWKLDAELVTLSACQTGLGRDAGGDGYLGFSQALFVAGARSLVVSLWEVDDTATSLLMTRFYENLMGLPKGLPGGPLEAKSKAEALKEAKEWLSRLRPDEVDQLAAGLPRTGTRGRVVPKAATEKAHPSYEHPYYWSGFILIGDPR
ncbi:MAG: CHAT domain-containing protein, partial [Zavarzinella sp.]|nr:CHAT domain-containing protein [Zavarzinella sp.]